MPPEAGGTGRGFLAYAFLNEEIGRSSHAQLVFGCQAPDAGNAEILHMFGTDEQKERWLRPLVAGEIRSFFSMTEPEVPGSDPTTLRTTARRDGDEWVIDGHKWFSSGADGAAFGIVMAVSDAEAEPHRRASQILVPADTPGVEVVRPIPVLGHTGSGLVDPLRGLVPRTFACRSRTRSASRATASGSRRSGSGRGGSTTSCAGWVRCSARSSSSARYALEREAFGSRLADKQTIQNWIADSAAEIHACRLMTLDAARKIDEGDEARVEVSLIKFYAAKALHDVIDRAIQVHGARGLTDETPLAAMYASARAARIYDGPDEVHRMVVSRRILKEFERGGHMAVLVKTNRRVTLAARPEGFPRDTDFALDEVEVGEPRPGEVLVRVLWASVDPYQRGRMSEVRSYAKSLELGDVITSQSLGEVVESQDGRYAPGDLVIGQLGWQEYAVARGGALRKVPEVLDPPTLALHVVGTTGLTAYFGLLDVGRPKPGETVVVSGAAGAVGQIVGQIAKLRAAGRSGSPAVPTSAPTARSTATTSRSTTRTRASVTS